MVDSDKPKGVTQWWTFWLSVAAAVFMAVLAAGYSWIRDNIFARHPDIFNHIVPFAIEFLLTVVCTAWIIYVVMARRFRTKTREATRALTARVAELEQTAFDLDTENSRLRNERQSFESVAMRKIAEEYKPEG